MENKLTAVEWIIKQINNKVIGDGDYRTLDDIFQQAKAIEKEQLLEFFMIGRDIGTSIEDAEETYNEMYGNTND